MIDTIELNNVATYTEKQFLTNLKEVNYIYGSNGSGKTTISRVLHDPDKYSTCLIRWENNQREEILVYNSDFVKEHVFEKDTLHGIFTLGSENIEILKEIDKKRKDLDQLDTDLRGLHVTLDGKDTNIGKKKEADTIQTEIEEKLWENMLPYKEKFKKCFEGYLGSKKAFKNKTIGENTSNQSPLNSEESLSSKYKQIFSQNISKKTLIAPVIVENLSTLENNSILQKIIIGSEDVDISDFIKKLDNSAWVHNGIQYYEKSDGRCPFCQQIIHDDFSKKLKEYFNDNYSMDLKKIGDLYNDYMQNGNSILRYLNELLNSEDDFIDKLQLGKYVTLLNKFIQNNIEKIKNKKDEPSRIFNIEFTTDTLNEINNLITLANEKIKNHNIVVDNLEAERKDLIGKVWKFILDKSKADIKSFLEKNKNIRTAIDNIERQIREKEALQIETKKELQNLEQQITSIQPTCDKINRILNSFGFQGFRLKVADKNDYELIRNDGTKVNNTLSEGEKNFLAFLYFYSLIEGSLTGADTNNNRVIVFDDPISSLDNEVLFVVSSLIRNIIIGRDSKYNNINQVFILTHNIYFYKEVSFEKNINSTKKTNRLKTKTYWIIKKRDNKSIITNYEKNPISTSYQVLWQEMKDDNPNPISLPNNMRRILENYFKTLGNISIDDLENKFDGDDKIICQALCSWINDGSHSCLGDEFYSPLDDVQIIKYKKVFKEIFDKQGHISHYNMMMGIDE